LTSSSLLYELAQGRFCVQAGGCHNFCQEAIFRLSRLTERQSERISITHRKSTCWDHEGCGQRLRRRCSSGLRVFKCEQESTCFLIRTSVNLHTGHLDRYSGRTARKYIAQHSVWSIRLLHMENGVWGSSWILHKAAEYGGRMETRGRYHCD
jgi:hypothetical protein